jgi:hypothetical protein
MQSTTNAEHDQWMEKIAQALHSFRRASRRGLEEPRAHAPDAAEENRATSRNERG